MSVSRGLPHLAAAVDLPEGEDCAELARLAERGGLDFVTLGGAGDVVGALAEVAAVTRRVGLVAMSVAGAAVAGLDRVSGGRGGGLVQGERCGGGSSGFPGARGGVSGHGCPLRVVDATDPAAWDVAARYGDVALVRVAGAGEADER
ncbi:LLM class flavin-dependent oxidoreductase, partial [Streptomyces sp. S6]